MVTYSEAIEKALKNRRGYRAGNYRVHYQKGAENEPDLFKLEHYGTVILEAELTGTKKVKVPCDRDCEEIQGLNWTERQKRCETCRAPHKDWPVMVETEVDAWKMTGWGGWSPSDRDALNTAFYVLKIDNVRAMGGEGGWRGVGRPLEVWVDDAPVNRDLEPDFDVEALEKQLEPLRAIFDVKYGTFFGTDGGTLVVHPKSAYKVLDSVNEDGLDRFNGFGQSCAVIRIEGQDLRPFTRFVLKIDSERLNAYSVNAKYHNTCKKCLKFITRDATLRQGDLCFKRVRKVPEFRKEVRVKRWRDEEGENVEIFEKEDEETGRTKEYARITRLPELQASRPGAIQEKVQNDPVHVSAVWDWTPNANPHVFAGQFKIWSLGNDFYVEAERDLVVLHAEHEKLPVPAGAYRFYAVSGLGGARRGGGD